MAKTLQVYLHWHKVGQLAIDNAGRLSFRYAKEWLAQQQAVPLSIALPLQEAVFDDAKARPFFANLLPESEVRQIIARKLGLSENNDFALLEAIGGECAGAVSLLHWVAFNYLIGNADAHGKNVSLLFTPRGAKLAPFYDLMGTAVYEDLANKMAMRIGGENRPDWVRPDKWQGFADDTGIALGLVHKTLQTVGAKMLNRAQALVDEIEAAYASQPVLAKITRLIKRRNAKITNSIEMR